MERLRSLDSLSSTLTMRSNTCGGGPSIDSNATVGPSVVIANAPEVAAPPPAQPPRAQAVASQSAAQPARSSVRRGREEVFDASLIVVPAISPKRLSV